MTDRDQGHHLAEGPGRGMGVGEGLEGQAEEPHSVVILHWNPAGLWCEGVGPLSMPRPTSGHWDHV